MCKDTRPIRTGGGAAERAGLENRYTFRGIVGSNPTLSAFHSLEQGDSVCSVLSTIISALAPLSDLDVSTDMPSIRRRHPDEEHRTQNATDGVNML
jgi:hypothetical protein